MPKAVAWWPAAREPAFHPSETEPVLKRNPAQILLLDKHEGLDAFGHRER